MTFEIDPRASPIVDEPLDPAASAIPWDNPYAVQPFIQSNLNLGFSHGYEVTRYSESPRSTRPSFPERFSVDPSGLMAGLDSLAKAPDVAFGVTRFVPGVQGIGDFLGNVGRSIEQSPLGAPLGAVGGAVSGALQQIAEAVMGRAVSTATEVGRTFDSANPDAFKLLDAPFRIAGAAVLGKTGVAAMDFGRQIDDSVWDDLPQDIADTISVAGLIPAMRVFGIVGRAAAGQGAGAGAAQALTGFTSPVGGRVFPTTAYNYGRWAGRVTAGTYGAGLATEFALPKVAGDEWWAGEIMESRIVPEDSAWRFPFELATSLPLDLFALTRAAAASKQSAWAAEKVFGTHPAPLRMVFDGIDNSIGTTLQQRNYEWGNYKLIEDTAANRLIDATNTNLPEADRIARYDWQEAARIRGQSPEQFKAAVADEIDRLFDEFGTRRVHEMAADTYRDWPINAIGADPGNQLQVLDTYAELGRKIEAAFPNKVLSVARDIERSLHKPLAINYLESIKEFGAAEKANFVKSFPSLADAVRDTATKNDLLRYLRESTDAPSATVLKVADSATAPLFEEVVTRPTTPPVRLGTLQAQLDDIDSRIFRGERLGVLRKSVTDEMATLREEVASGVAKQKTILEAERASRESDLLTGNLSKPEADALREHIRNLDEQIARANEDYYRAFTAGSRWTIHTPPSGPVMRIDDAIYRRGKAELGQRTAAGKVYDALFGAVRNADIGRASLQKVMDAGAASGATPELMTALMDRMRDFVEAGTFRIGSAQFRFFASAWHLPSVVIDHLAGPKGINLPRPVGYSSWSEVIYRAYPGPFNILAERLGKELPKVPYSPAFHTVTRSIYGTFRFTLDPRFLALNFKEADILELALAKKGTPDAAVWERYIELVRRAEKEVTDTGAIDLSGRRKSIAAYAASRRPDEYTRVFADYLKKHDAMRDVLAQHGITSDEQMIGYLEKTMSERYGLFENARAATDAEKQLERALKDAESKARSVLGDGPRRLAQSEAEALQEKLVAAVREREFRDEALKQGWKPELQPFLDAMVAKDQQLTKDALRVFRGNPDRSAIERAGNSFLLFWPLSYQLKAGKALAEFLLSKSFGYQTGSAGATTWLEFRMKHDQMLEEDPEYAAFFKANRQLFFVMGQIIPITPEDLGISLSPLTRVGFRAARGESAQQIWESLTNQGAIYSYKLGSDIVREQSRPGSLWSEVFDALSEDAQ